MSYTTVNNNKDKVSIPNSIEQGFFDKSSVLCEIVYINNSTRTVKKQLNITQEFNNDTASLEVTKDQLKNKNIYKLKL